MLLYYIRHGDPVYEPDGLTALGAQQAAALAKRLARCGVDEIYASSSNRAQLTAKPTAELLHKQITTLDWCNEAYAWEELTVKRNGARKWLFQDEETRFKFASEQLSALGKDWCQGEFSQYREEIERIGKNAFAFLKTLGYERDKQDCYYHAISPNEKRIALFAHEGFGLAFLSAVLDIPYPAFCTRFGLEHSSLSVISFTGTDKVIPCLLQLSNDSHLYKEGLPTKYNNQIDI